VLPRTAGGLHAMDRERRLNLILVAIAVLLIAPASQ
jgi:hypothetical protein